MRKLAVRLLIVFGISLLASYHISNYLSPKKSVHVSVLPANALAPMINNPKYLYPIVRLHLPGGGRFVCTGTVITPDYILTAAHCLTDGPFMDIYTYTGVRVATAMVAGFSPLMDQGILVAPGIGLLFNRPDFETDAHKVLQIITDPEAKLVSCGFPVGARLLCVPITDVTQFRFSLKATGFVYPGMSGGPVFDARTNTVVGIITGVIEEGIIINPILEIYENLDIPQE